MFKKMQLNSQNKILIFSFAAFIFVYFLVERKNSNSQTEKEPIKPITADTVIPKGFVLVPIQLANKDAVQGLIDQYGVLDLYLDNSPSLENIQVASKVKVLRAPLNPDQYAVLVTEEKSKELMKYKGPFLAVVQNRLAQNPTLSVTPKNETKVIVPAHLHVDKIEIEYQQERNL